MQCVWTVGMAKTLLYFSCNLFICFKKFCARKWKKKKKLRPLACQRANQLCHTEWINPFFMWLPTVLHCIVANGILLPIIDLKCSFNGYSLSISSVLLHDSLVFTHTSIRFFSFLPSLEFYFIFAFLTLLMTWLSQWKERTSTKNKENLGKKIHIFALFYFQTYAQMKKYNVYIYGRITGDFLSSNGICSE